MASGWREIVGYYRRVGSPALPQSRPLCVVAPVIAAICAVAMLWFIASGHAGWTPGSFANGYADLSPDK